MGVLGIPRGGTHGTFLKSITRKPLFGWGFMYSRRDLNLGSLGRICGANDEFRKGGKDKQEAFDFPPMGKGVVQNP
jgi:hypothetical protein